MKRGCPFLLVGLSLSLCGEWIGAAELQPLLTQIKTVGREGAGNVAAGQAWRELVRSSPEDLPTILAALDDADATAANWLRAVVDAIAERALSAKRPLPAEQLEAFIRQKQHNPAGRRLAYEWLVRVDPKAPDRLLAGMLQDPSTEIRRDAVEVAIKEAQQHFDNGSKPSAIAGFRRALSGARDRDQVERIANQLKTLGAEVDLAAHFGVIQKWQLLAPFDSTGGVGFQQVYPPERGIDLGTTWKGKKDAPLRWIAHSAADPYGLVDLNKVIGKHMGVVAYAYAIVESPSVQPVQVRAGSNNAVKIFLNGKEIFFREEYHHGMQMDQHVGFGSLRTGRNDILIKVCQNEQTEEWAQSWSFQLRVCDALGGAVPMTVVTDKVNGRATESGER